MVGYQMRRAIEGVVRAWLANVTVTIKALIVSTSATIQSLNVGTATGAGPGVVKASDYINTATYFLANPGGGADAYFKALSWSTDWCNFGHTGTVGYIQNYTSSAAGGTLQLQPSGGGVSFAGATVEANYAFEGPNSSTNKAKCYAWDTYASSLKWKTNVAPVADPLGKLAMLRGITFTHAPGRPMAGEPGIGIAAEELEMLGLPGLVTRDDQGEYSGINMMLLTPLLVEAIKEQQQQIASLRAEVAVLKARTG